MIRGAGRRLREPARGPVVWLCSLLLVSCGTTRDRDPDSLDFYVESLRGQVGPTAAIRIDNPWGDIRVRNHDVAGEVRVEAAVQRIGTLPPPAPRLLADETPDRFALEVSYPGANHEPRSGRVDLVVLVPAGHVLQLHARDGRVEAKKIINSVYVETADGPIHVFAQGEIELRSVSGDIVARPWRPGWGELRIVSGAGDVIVFVPAGEFPSIRVRGATGVRGDFPLELAGAEYLLTSSQQAGEPDSVTIDANSRVEIYKVISAAVSQ